MTDHSLYVDYVFVDKNCKLKIRSKAGSYLSFNSKPEFYSIIHRLRFEHFSSDEHLKDEEAGFVERDLNVGYY